jgi:hypothetical protein
MQHADHVSFGQKHLATDARSIVVSTSITGVDLDGDVAPVIGIVGEIDRAGAATANLIDNEILAAS